MVIDPFCGTGSVGVAATMLGGYALLSDIDKRTSKNARFHVKRQLALNEFAPTTGLLCAGEREEAVNLPDPDQQLSQEDNEEEDLESAFTDDSAARMKKVLAVPLRELNPAAGSSSSGTSSSTSGSTGGAPVDGAVAAVPRRDKGGKEPRHTVVSPVAEG